MTAGRKGKTDLTRIRSYDPLLTNLACYNKVKSHYDLVLLTYDTERRLQGAYFLWLKPEDI
jgi:hypothetical protein